MACCWSAIPTCVSMDSQYKTRRRMNTPYIRVEAPTKDGRKISDIIKEFFLRKCSINDSESYYEMACTMGEELGVEAFDESIVLICKELELDPKELEKIVQDSLIELEE